MARLAGSGMERKDEAMASADGRAGERDNFYRLTGEVIRSWARLELALALWLTDLLGIDELRARMIWDSHGSFAGKMTLLKALTRNFADEGLWAEARAICADAEAIAENRYILPHAFGEVDAAERRLSFRSEKCDADFIIDFTAEKSVDTAMLGSWMRALDDCRNRADAFKAGLRNRVHETSLMHRRSA